MGAAPKIFKVGQLGGAERQMYTRMKKEVQGRWGRVATRCAARAATMIVMDDRDVASMAL